MDPKRQSHSAGMSGPTARAGTGTDVWESWHRASHLVFYGLLALSALLVLPDSSLPWMGRAAAVGLAMLLGGWYRFAVMSRPGWIQERPLTGLGYFAVTGILFLGLIFLHPTFMLLAFSLYWQVFSFWPTRWASPGAVMLTAAMWWRSAASDGGPLPPGGAAVFFFLITVVVVTVLSNFIGAIIGQSEERKRLIEELEATRRELAAEEHRAGTLEERGRLAREIHDTLAQGFVGIVTQLEAADADLPIGMEATRRRLDAARRIARDNLTEARRLVAALRPEILEGASLPEALRRVAARWSDESGAVARVTVTGDETPLPQDLQVTLLRAGQEALANAGRHAQASRVEITLSYLEDLVLLDVQDDGRGFDPDLARARPGGGFGIEAMRERVECLGGRLLIESGHGESGHGQGTTLTIQLPLEAERRRPRPQEVG